jgi:hypothetical protein
MPSGSSCTAVVRWPLGSSAAGPNEGASSSRASGTAGGLLLGDPWRETPGGGASVVPLPPPCWRPTRAGRPPPSKRGLDDETDGIAASENPSWGAAVGCDAPGGTRSAGATGSPGAGVLWGGPAGTGAAWRNLPGAGIALGGPPGTDVSSGGPPCTDMPRRDPLGAGAPGAIGFRGAPAGSDAGASRSVAPASFVAWRRASGDAPAGTSRGSGRVGAAAVSSFGGTQAWAGTSRGSPTTSPSPALPGTSSRAPAPPEDAPVASVFRYARPVGDAPSMPSMRPGNGTSCSTSCSTLSPRTARDAPSTRTGAGGSAATEDAGPAWATGTACCSGRPGACTWCSAAKATCDPSPGKLPSGWCIAPGLDAPAPCSGPSAARGAVASSATAPSSTSSKRTTA